MKSVKLVKTITGAEVIVRLPNGLAGYEVDTGKARPTTKGAWRRVNRGARQRARMESAQRRFKSKAAKRAEKQRRAFVRNVVSSEKTGLLQKTLDAGKRILAGRAKKGG